MSGIVFWSTQNLDEIRMFYEGVVGCSLWLNQGDCMIFRHGNFLFGFCERDKTSVGGILTFFYPTKEEVDDMYLKLKDKAIDLPKTNDKYSIYHFFASDPEGRKIEFQHFNNDLEGFLSGDDLLLTRRSIRNFEDKPVSEEDFLRLVDMTRFAPTSKNSQSFYFKPIKDSQILEKLASLRAKSSAPISKAPMAVAICSDPIISQRYIQDACIGAYHFILAAWYHGLGTVWIAAMDRDDAKEMLGIPRDHYIATITPLGYPREKLSRPPVRKPIEWFLR